jgi:hypothetical protein
LLPFLETISLKLFSNLFPEKVVENQPDKRPQGSCLCGTLSDDADDDAQSLMMKKCKKTSF